MKELMARSAAAIAVVLAMTANPAARQMQAPAADPTEWTIDSNHSAATFAVKHMLVSTVRGTLGPVSGKIWYDGKNVSAIRAEVSIDTKSLSTANARRDTHLKTDDFFNVEKFPAITFKSKRAILGAAGAFKLVGDLTIRDVTKEVTLDVEVPATAVTDKGTSRTATTATTTINRFDYGLRWNSLIEAGGAVVGPDVKITIDLEVIRK